MKRILATPDEGGQITLPDEVLDALGVQAGGFITFAIDEAGKVMLTKTSVADLKGIIPALDRPASDDFDAEIDEAMQDLGDEIVRNLSGR
jgi:bifunctional DNA-binding transcriptional regulator/antitoxin component of YhaV-PrlF toxin-antitoxin module